MNSARIKIGLATCGIAAGAKKVLDAFRDYAEKAGVVISLEKTGCIGMCEFEPIAEITRDGLPTVTYGRITPESAARIIDEHIINGRIVEDLLLGSIEEDGSYKPPQLFSKQRRLVLRKCGVIDPESMDDYVSMGGYHALKKVLTSMSPDEVIEEVKQSGLRGRGGAGFSTGMKWEFARKSPGPKKYIICNADEGDPGAFMDRSVLEGDPHAVIEGMVIAGYAIGADEGYVYVRAEYPLAIERLGLAIEQAEKAGLLGDNIAGSGFSFSLRIKEGAGAFVCGEETALMASIEGKRGMPRTRPPFPAAKGLWGYPTNINNVETYANISVVFGLGAREYSSIGTEKSKGTKVFALTGQIINTGLVEVPMGITIREIIFEIGGGIRDGKKYKAVQIGGPSGGCLPASALDIPIDYDSLLAAGATMGSGGLVVMAEDTCMVSMAKYFLKFIQEESCGKCTPCREGTKRMLEMLSRITEGKGEESDLEKLERLGRIIRDTALCGLGQTAPNSVLSTLRYFRDEYEAHIRERRCPAGSCKELVVFSINQAECKACGLCRKACPVGAISQADLPEIQDQKRRPYKIDPNICIKCGACLSSCKFGAVKR